MILKYPIGSTDLREGDLVGLDEYNLIIPHPFRWFGVVCEVFRGEGMATVDILRPPPYIWNFNFNHEHIDNMSMEDVAVSRELLIRIYNQLVNPYYQRGPRIIHRQLVQEDEPIGCYFLSNNPCIDQEAIDKADKLLLKCLNQKQQKTYKKEGWFVVESSLGNRYKISAGPYGVKLLDKKGKDKREHCLQLKEVVPNADQLLALKLLIEADESRFLLLANSRPARTLYPQYYI